ncbi:5931_t:CDS:2, partial [Gigaspora rosea]
TCDVCQRQSTSRPHEELHPLEWPKGRPISDMTAPTITKFIYEDILYLQLQKEEIPEELLEQSLDLHFRKLQNNDTNKDFKPKRIFKSSTETERIPR